LEFVCFLGFKCVLSILISLKRKPKTFSGKSFSFKMSFLFLLIFIDWSVIVINVVVFITVVTPNFEKGFFRLLWSYWLGGNRIIRVSEFSRILKMLEIWNFLLRINFKIFNICGQLSFMPLGRLSSCEPFQLVKNEKMACQSGQVDCKYVRLALQFFWS
jgi:hypothetical protein